MGLFIALAVVVAVVAVAVLGATIAGLVRELSLGWVSRRAMSSEQHADVTTVHQLAHNAAAQPCRSGHTDCTADCGWCKGTGYTPVAGRLTFSGWDPAPMDDTEAEAWKGTQR